LPSVSLGGGGGGGLPAKYPELETVFIEQAGFKKYFPRH
jgi:hypothetical protein